MRAILKRDVLEEDNLGQMTTDREQVKMAQDRMAEEDIQKQERMELDSTLKEGRIQMKGRTDQKEERITKTIMKMNMDQTRTTLKWLLMIKVKEVLEKTKKNQKTERKRKRVRKTQNETRRKETRTTSLLRLETTDVTVQAILMTLPKSLSRPAKRSSWCWITKSMRRCVKLSESLLLIWTALKSLVNLIAVLLRMQVRRRFRRIKS
jgi:hypothetical protein